MLRVYWCVLGAGIFDNGTRNPELETRNLTSGDRTQTVRGWFVEPVLESSILSDRPLNRCGLTGTTPASEAGDGGSFPLIGVVLFAGVAQAARARG